MILVRELEQMMPLTISRCRLEDNTKIDIRETGFVGVR
jgi:hypothetical protein